MRGPLNYGSSLSILSVACPVANTKRGSTGADKDVCRIDYFSANIYNDLLVAGDVITGGVASR